MGSKYRPMPPDLIRSQLSISNRLSTMETSPRAPQTTVNETGGNSFKFVASNGTEVVKFGDLGVGIGTGWSFRRPNNNSLAFWLGGNVLTSNFWALNDNANNIIISDDASSGEGLARPYVPYSTVKFSDYSNASVTTASTSFVPAYLVLGKKQHPRISVQYIISTPVGVSAEVQLADTSSNTIIIGGPTAFGSNTYAVSSFTTALDGNHLDEIKVDLQFRVSGGAGTIGILLTYAYGVQS